MCKRYQLPFIKENASLKINYQHRCKSRLSKKMRKTNYKKKKSICKKIGKEDTVNLNIKRYYRKLKYIKLDPEYCILMDNNLKMNRDHIVTENLDFEYDVSVDDLLKVMNNEWLNDNVINFYLCLLQKRNIQRYNVRANLRVYIFSSFFFQKLNNNGYLGVKRWSKSSKFSKFNNAKSIFDFDKIIIPIHSGNHWYCGCINFKTTSIECYDSLNNNSLHFFKTIGDYLVNECKSKTGYEMDLQKWNLKDNKDFYPQQNNTKDCGIFTLKCMDWLSDDLYPDYKQADISYFRKRLVIEILIGGTLD